MRSPKWLFLLPLMLLAASAQAAVMVVDGGIEFRYTDASANSVHLAGDFNDWSTTADPLSDDDGDGTWSIVLDLGPGSHEYKFVVNGGTWVTDPDNSRTGGDYGNSLVGIGPNGQITDAPEAVVTSGTPVVSNNTLNSQVYLGGYFRMIMEGVSNQSGGDEQLRLERPDDQFNLDVTANLSQKLWGSVRLQVLTERDGANELSASLYKAQSNFIDDDFRVQAYYNEEVFESDEPLELLGHADLRGTIREEHRPFGQGTQGVVFRFRPWDSDFALLYSDTYDEDIFNPDRPTPRLNTNGDRLNQNTGTDLLGLRWTKEIAGARLGMTYRGVLSDWWVGFDNTDNVMTPDLEAHVAAQGRADPGDETNWFELANDHHTGAFDALVPVTEQLSAHIAAGYSWYEAKWDMGNKETLQGTDWTNGEVDFGIGNENGYRGELELEFKREGFRAVASHQFQWFQGMDAGENFIAYRTGPGSTISDLDGTADSGLATRYVNVNSNNAVDILRLDPRPERFAHITEFDLSYRRGQWTAALEVDRKRENMDYLDFFGTGSASFDRSTWRFSPRLRLRPFESPEHHFTLESEFLTIDDPGRMETVAAAQGPAPAPGQGFGSMLRLETREVLLKGLLPVPRVASENLDFKIDVRWISYEGTDGLLGADPDGAGTLEAPVLDLTDTFIAPFLALVYKPADAVRIHVGYGVDPDFYNVISPEGWPNGRQQFRDIYLLDRGMDPYHPVNVLLAEQILEDQRQFVINAFVKF